MTDDDLAERGDANLFESWRIMASAAASGHVEEADGLLLASCGVPVGPFNGAFITCPTDRPGHAVSRSVGYFGERDLPFLLRIREGLDRRVEAEARAAGLVPVEPLPAMAVQLDELRPRRTVRSMQIRAVRDAAGLRDHVSLLVAAFGVPFELGMSVMGPGVVAKGLRPYVGYIDGAPVATAALLVTGSTAGIYNVATAPYLQRRGLAGAMTLHVLAQGAEEGCVAAILQASSMGRRLYELMGFRDSATYLQFASP
ncbi:MAG: hypothetical protein AVDCRST_MAG50-560 [uncultured Acidimicrobiales bacterium]|uniref:N-acetyltransferase domain-containing protein n=1 Tax=uncultured Acidimicrobiales bacterium TaxID=310071 RepID=A0A6J4HDM6_9ACTN|nr:MAG: hypothetical protein AVDCRST_MAG50-560 [uncultured Acidimicrobiales bacterium]